MRLASALLCAVTATALASPPSKTCERAIKLYDTKDFLSATIELHKVLTGNTSDDKKNLQRARFFMGKALFNLGFYVPAYSSFDMITQEGASHTYYTASIKWHAAIAENLPELAVDLGKYSAKDIQEPINDSARDQIAYRRGLLAIQQGKLADAGRDLERVPAASPYFGRAMLALAIAKLRAKQPATALTTLAKIPAGDPVQDLAALATGQELARTSKWDAAIAAYGKIDAKSKLATRAAWDTSWIALARQGKAPAALAAVATTPVLDPDGPESPTLIAAVAFDFCTNKKGLDALAGFRASAPTIEKQLQTILADADDPDFYTKHVQKLRGGTAGTLAPRLQLLAHSALNGPAVNRRAALVTEIERELALVQSSQKAWQSTAIAAEVMTELTLVKSLAEANVAVIARERLRQLAADLVTLRRAAATKVVVSAPGGSGLAVLCP